MIRETKCVAKSSLYHYHIMLNLHYIDSNCFIVDPAFSS